MTSLPSINAAAFVLELNGEELVVGDSGTAKAKDEDAGKQIGDGTFPPLEGLGGAASHSSF
jgi:hypothetical protein